MQDDPRLLQCGFALLVLLETALRVPAGLPAWPSWPAGGLSLLVVVTLATVLAPRPGTPGPYVWVAGADLAVVGLTRLTPEGSAAAILSVLPVLWLARHLGRRGAWAGGAAALLLVSAPGIAYAGVDGAGLARAVLPPAVAVTAGLVIASGVRRAELERAEATRRGHDLAAALDTIEHQRRTAEAILDTVDVGLLLLDEQGRYVGRNKRHEDFMALAFPDGHDGTAGQLGQVRHADAVTAMARDEMPTHRARLGEEFDDIRIWVGQGAERRALSVSARSIRDESGRQTGSALAYKDVTDFMEAMEVKDAFVASVSHELRTPLTSIAGYLDVLLERADLPAQAVRHLEIAERNAHRLERLVADLLSTAVADASPTAVQRATVDLAALVREQVEAARPVAAARQVELVGCAAGEVAAYVDSQRVRQVVDNLLSNALKHTPAGGRVRVELVPGDAQLEVCVSDTGPGIDPAERDQVFGRFFRTRAARDQVLPGVGLGLAITRDIVAAHDGRIELDDAPGGGLRARVLLPRGGGAVGSGA